MYRIVKKEGVKNSIYKIQEKNSFLWFTFWSTLHDGYSDLIFITQESAEFYLDKIKTRGTSKIITSTVKIVE